MNHKAKFQCDPSMIPHCNKVFKGEYDYIQFPYKDINTIVDIGANAGAFVIWAAAKWPKAKIHAYEPSRENFAHLKANVENFELTDRVTIYNKAVSDFVGTGFLTEPTHNAGDRELKPLITLGNDVAPKGEEVDVTSIGSVPNCDFMKIDCEGSEFKIIPAMTQRPRFIAMEFHNIPFSLFAKLIPPYQIWGMNQIVPTLGTVKLVKDPSRG